MTTQTYILAWETPWTEEPDGLQFMGSQELEMICWLNNSKEPESIKWLLFYGDFKTLYCKWVSGTTIHN